MIHILMQKLDFWSGCPKSFKTLKSALYILALYHSSLTNLCLNYSRRFSIIAIIATQTLEFLISPAIGSKFFVTRHLPRPLYKNKMLLNMKYTKDFEYLKCLRPGESILPIVISLHFCDLVSIDALPRKFKFFKFSKIFKC